LVGSTNPTEHGLNQNRNNFLVIGSRFLSEHLEEEFDELWNGVYGDGMKVKYPEVILIDAKK